MNSVYRQTGRTYRLILQALTYADRGVRVVIYTSKEHRKHLADQVREVAHKRSRRLPEHLIVAEIMEDNFDWALLQPRGARYPEHLALVDHHCIEKHLNFIEDQILKLQRLAKNLQPLTVGVGFPVPAHIQAYAEQFEATRKSMDYDTRNE